jgi:hypothetical protein
MIDSVVVQSPFLKSALGSVLKGYPEVTTELERLTFSAPFQPLIHRWDELVKARDDEPDPETKQHLELFVQIMNEELKDTIADMKYLMSHNVITFRLLWAIFRPGDIIMTVENGRECCQELKNGNYINSWFQISCENIEWGGARFGLNATGCVISAFDGTTPITQLEAFPFEFHPDKESIRMKLVTRGRKFEELRGYHYKVLRSRVNYKVDPYDSTLVSFDIFDATFLR